MLQMSFFRDLCCLYTVVMLRMPKACNFYSMLVKKQIHLLLRREMPTYILGKAQLVDYLPILLLGILKF
jgi:hypothetical protein